MIKFRHPMRACRAGSCTRPPLSDGSHAAQSSAWHLVLDKRRDVRTVLQFAWHLWP